MATYLIDYENVNKDGLNGVSKLTEQDRVIIFYSERADRMTFGLHRRLNETKAVIEYKKVDVGGHNALDFQLATYLGFLIASDSTEQYCVVSNDRGFEFLTGFWRKPQYNVCLAREIANSPQAEERREERRQARKQKKAAEAAEKSREDARGTEDPGEDIKPLEKPSEAAQADAGKDDGVSLADVAESFADNLMNYIQNGLTAVSDMKNTGKTGEDAGSYEAEKQNSVNADDREKFDAAFRADEEEEKNSGSRFWFRNGSGRNDYAERVNAGEEKSEEKSEEEIQPEEPVQESFVKEAQQEPEKPENSESEAEEKTAEDPQRDAAQTDEAVTEETDEGSGKETLESKKRNSQHRHSGRRRGSRGSASKKALSPEQEQRIIDVKAFVNESKITGEALTESDYGQIASFIGKYKTKQGVNNALVRSFGNQRAGEIYQMIKPMLKDKKGRNGQ